MIAKKILLTGVAGFIGSNLSKKLLEENGNFESLIKKREKFKVIGIDNLSAGTLENIPNGVEFFKMDIRDKEIYPLFKGVDVVFHLAAKNCLMDCLNDPLDTSDVNVKGTVNVLEASKAAEVKKFIYADSSAEYEGVYEFPSKVNRVHPIGTYAVSKRAGALFCESYQEIFGLNVINLRYFNVYGPAQDWQRVIPPVMSAFILKLLKRERPIIYGTGEKRRDFIYIDDVNDFHLKILENDQSSGKTYNVGTGVNYSINEIYQLIDEILQTGIKPIYKENLPGEAEVTLADISESEALGWKPKTAIKEGLKKSIEYIKEKVLDESNNISCRKG